MNADRPARRPTAASEAVERALREGVGREGLEHLATAQARIAWREVFGELGLERIGAAQLVRLRDGVASIEASDSLLAQELGLRRATLVQQLNRRLRGRPGARPVLDARVSVGRRYR